MILGGTNLIPPATAVNYVPWAIVAFTFQYLVRRRHFSWWAKYNCEPLHPSVAVVLGKLRLTLPSKDVLSAALDSGVAIAAILIFFCLEYPENGNIGKDTIQKWWGNTVSFTNADAAGTPFKLLPEGGFFG